MVSVCTWLFSFEVDLWIINWMIIDVPPPQRAVWSMIQTLMCLMRSGTCASCAKPSVPIPIWWSLVELSVCHQVRENRPWILLKYPFNRSQLYHVLFLSFRKQPHIHSALTSPGVSLSSWAQSLAWPAIPWCSGHAGRSSALDLYGFWISEFTTAFQ